MNQRRAAKGGIGQERFPLDPAADVGRDNHSNETIETQKKLMMKQIGEATRLVATLGLYPWQIVQRSRLYVIVSMASFIFTRIDLL